MTQKQELLSLSDPDSKSTQEPSSSYIKQQHINNNEQDEKKQGQAVIQQPNETMLLLQQLLAKQDLLLVENRQLRQEMTTQQITINHLSQAVRTIQGAEILRQNLLPTDPSSLSTTAPSSLATTAPSSLATTAPSLLSTTAPSPQLTLPLVMNAASSLKEQAAKQLQSKRINQLLDSTPFTGSSSQEVSDWIDEFSNKCDKVQLDDDQRLSVAIDLLKGNAKLWYDTHKDTIDSWTALKNKLTVYFQLVTGTDQFQLEQKLYNRRRQTNELAIDYCHNVLKLCSKVNKHMDDDIRLKHLTKGLNAAAQIHMDLKSPGTTEEFLQDLVKYDKWQEEGKIQQSRNTSFDHRSNIPTRAVQHPLMQQEQYSSIPRQQYNHSSQQHQPQYPTHGLPQTQHNNNNKNNYDGCWSCGGMDHYQYQCSKNY